MVTSMRSLLRLPLLCTLLLCLLAIQGGYTWCIGADGHNHAKSTLSLAKECCDPHQAAASDQQGQEPGFSASAHGQCLHIAITSQWSTASSRDSQPLDETAATIPSSSSLTSSLQLPVPCLTNGLIPEPSPRIAEPLLYHRTVVLLI